jgi:hypothetical protein
MWRCDGGTAVSTALFGKHRISLGCLLSYLLTLAQRSTSRLRDTDVIHISDYVVAIQAWDRVNKIILSATQRGVIYDQLGKHKLNNSINNDGSTSASR